MGRYTRVLVQIIGSFYGGIALVYIVPVVVHFLLIPTQDFFDHPMIAVVLAVPLVNGLVCAAIAYSFFAFRNWGRYVAITYNSLLISYLTLAISAGIKVADTNLPTVTFFLLMIALVLIIVFCFSTRARILMKENSAVPAAS